MSRLPQAPRVFSAQVVAFLLAGGLSSIARAGLGPPSPANPLLFGANQNSANYDDPINNASWNALVKNLNIQNLRHIGGSPASFWDWNPGKFVPESEITAIWPSPWFVNNGANDWVNAQAPGTFSVDAAVTSAASAGVDTVQWVANLTTRENDQAAFITYLDDEGYDFSYIEADNEAYFWGNEFAAGGGGREYGKRIGSNLAPTVRAKDPNAKIGATFRSKEFFNGQSESGGFAVNWNANLWGQRNFATGSQNIDALILHHYDMDSDGLAGYSTADRSKAFLGYPQASLERAAGVAEASYGDLPIWLTEYNVIAYNQSSGGGSNGQWIRDTKNTGWNALYIAGFYLTAISNPDDITVMNHHAISGFGGWAFGQTVSTSQAEINVTGQVFSHVADLMSQADEMMEVVPDTNPNLGVSIVGDSSLGIFQAAGLVNSTDEVLTILVMNRDDTAHDFELSGYGNYGQLEIVTYEAEDSGANDYETVLLNTATPIYAQASAPFTPLSSSSSLTPGQSLDISLPQYSFSILTLSDLVSGLAGDYNEDGVVDGNDFLVWQRNPSVGNLSDWQGNYGMSAPLLVANASTVPEPATGVLLFLLQGVGTLIFDRQLTHNNILTL